MNYVGKYPRCDTWIFPIFVNVLVRHIRTDVRKEKRNNESNDRKREDQWEHNANKSVTIYWKWDLYPLLAFILLQYNERHA